MLGSVRGLDLSPCGVFLTLDFWSSFWAAVDSAVVVSTFSIKSAKPGCGALGFSCFGYLKGRGMWHKRNLRARKLRNCSAKIKTDPRKRT